MPPEDDETDGTPRGLHAPWTRRGTEMGRILALSDGVFAFAMTLLVLSLVLPASAQGIGVQRYLLDPKFLHALFAYVITFFVIAVWWQGHHLLFSYIQRYDGTLLRLNVVFLIFIAILPFSTQVLNAAGNEPVGVVFFAVLQIAAGSTMALLWRYATGRGRLVPADLPPQWVRYVQTGQVATSIVFAISIPVAFVSTLAAEILWIAIFAVGYWNRRSQPP